MQGDLEGLRKSDVEYIGYVSDLKGLKLAFPLVAELKFPTPPKTIHGVVVSLVDIVTPVS